ncbi:hypothetical protein F5050DRAFT_1577045 [Lentinula boryana]|uniref:INO80 complex subunit B-like conserved region domain-containing protein n=1 Tax=Lentinula boryana TaxID=40481 RepID=A0ABQ8Q5F6_9AGAR|nr:hypothetical protein F5050DRAFT_1577045 [Lentinula boryana]
MTTRQAVLASVVDSSHIALGNSSKKKKVLNETELALRREENARKRKNLSEKRLEDEKLETINRLLKKQTRPRTKRTGATGSSATPLPAVRSTSQDQNAAKIRDDSTGDVDMADASNESNVAPPPSAESDENRALEVPLATKPSTVSTSSNGGIADNSALERRMQFYLAIPAAFLPPEDQSIPTPLPLPEIRPPATCAVSGCGDPRKYRLVKDWKIGACGMAHLKVLEGMI